MTLQITNTSFNPPSESPVPRSAHNTLTLAQKMLQQGATERKVGGNQLQPLDGGLYYSESRINAVTSQRGNKVLAAWRAYDENRIYEENGNGVDDWFGRKINGPLWLCMGVDKVTGRLRPPVANISYRITGANDIRGQSGTMTQVVNNFVTVQGNNMAAFSRLRRDQSSNIQATEEPTNLIRSRFRIQRPFFEQPPDKFEIPLRVTAMNEIFKQWVSSDTNKNAFKPLMKWTLEEQNNGSNAQIQDSEKRSA